MIPMNYTSDPLDYILLESETYFISFLLLEESWFSLGSADFCLSFVVMVTVEELLNSKKLNKKKQQRNNEALT